MELLFVAKLALYGMFLNYYCYYVITGTFIPYGTIIFFGVAAACVGVNVLKDQLVHVGKEMRCWAFYGLLALITMGFAVDPSGVVGDVLKYMQRLALIAMIAYICEKEHSIRFGLRLLAVDAVACAIAILYMVDDIQQKLSISSSANLSANDVGALMAFGVFAVLFAFGKKTSIITSLIKAAFIIAMVTVIFLAGSRKSIFAVIILLALLILFCGKDYIKRSSIMSIMTIVVVCAIAFWFINKNLAPHVEETNLYVRLFGRGAEAADASNDARVELYILALQEFFKRPILGLGFNNFVVVHGNYTHSTYVETLACNGLIGLLYLFPYYYMLKNQIKLIRLNAHDYEEYTFQKEMLAFLLMFLFVGIGVPYMYKDNPCIILGMIIASQYNSYRRLRIKRQE
ncbi:O-antigen ligase family protein [Dorea sp. YH-dor226]|uniref:O-antigen ligase family protein n=1 Tax=Dorea sp. YH-dor226 TaxID=3151119 RepID=UPI003242072D